MSAAANPSDGKIWYQVLDDKWDKLYYAPAEHIRTYHKRPTRHMVAGDITAGQVRSSIRMSNLNIKIMARWWRSLSRQLNKRFHAKPLSKEKNFVPWYPCIIGLLFGL